jgi:hypothetical protein
MIYIVNHGKRPTFTHNPNENINFMVRLFRKLFLDTLKRLIILFNLVFKKSSSIVIFNRSKFINERGVIEKGVQYSFMHMKAISRAALVALLLFLIVKPNFGQKQLGEIITGNSEYGLLGSDVSISDQGTVVIGIPFDDFYDSNAGLVYVYNLETEEFDTLMATSFIGGLLDGQGGLGHKVCISDDGLVVAASAPYYDEDDLYDIGLVVIWENINGVWQQRGDAFIGSGSNIRFGEAIDLSSDGSVLIVGSPRSEIGGDVKVFDWDGSSWNLRGQAILGGAGDQLGTTVAISSDGGTIACGAPGYGTPSAPGIIRVYDWTSGNWQQRGNQISGNSGYRVAGRVLAMSGDGNTIGVNLGNEDLVRIYSWSSSTWQQVAEVADTCCVYFGQEISFSYDGAKVAIGDPFVDIYENIYGKVNVYSWDGNNYVAEKYSLSGEVIGDKFGYSVDLSTSGDTIAIGSPFYDVRRNKGAVAIFDIGALQKEQISVYNESNRFLVNSDGEPSVSRGTYFDYSTDNSNHAFKIINTDSVAAYIDTIIVTNEGFIINGSTNYHLLPGESELFDLFLVDPSSYSCGDTLKGNVKVLYNNYFGEQRIYSIPIGAIFDSSPPVALCKNARIYIPAGANDVNIDESLINNGSFDECGDISISLSTTTLSSQSIGCHELIMNVFDESGLQDSCSAVVELIDSLTTPHTTGLISDTVKTICMGDSISISLVNDLRKALILDGKTDLVTAIYRFNGNTLNAQGKYHLSSKHAAAFSADRFGYENKALYLSGAKDTHFELLEPILFNEEKRNEYSYSFWFSTLDSLSAGRILGGAPRGPHYDLSTMYYSNSGISLLRGDEIFGFSDQLFFSLPNNVVSIEPSSIDNSVWNHVTAVKKNDSLSIFLNGQLASSIELDLSPYTSCNWFTGANDYDYYDVNGCHSPDDFFFNRVGASESTSYSENRELRNESLFDGKLDDLIIWNKAIDSSDVSLLYSNSIRINWSTGDTSSLIKITPSTSTTYYVTVTDGVYVLSDSIEVNVTDLFQAGSIYESGETLCYEGFPSEIGSTSVASGGDGNINYTWRSSVDNFTSNIAGATGATYTPPAGITQSVTYRRYANDQLCNTEPIASTGEWVLTVLPEFSPGEINNTGETICYEGFPSEIGSTSVASGGDGNINYTWRSSADNFTSNIAGATGATYIPMADNPQTITYRRYAYEGTCSTTPLVSSGKWMLTKLPEFSSGKIDSAGDTLCYGGTPKTIGSLSAATGGDGNISYQWVATSEEFTFSTSGGDVGATYMPSEGDFTETTIFRRYAYDGTCNTSPALSEGEWVLMILDNNPSQISELCQEVSFQILQDQSVILDPLDLISDELQAGFCTEWEVTASLNILDCSKVGQNEVQVSLFTPIDTFNCISTVYVEDSFAPTLACNDTVVNITDGTHLRLSLDLLQASLTDNCTLTDTIILPGKLSCTDTGDNEVVILAEDASGNIGMCTATVTVINEEVPVAQCRDREVSLNQEGMASLTALDLDDGSYSNCGTLSYTASQLSFSCEDGSVQTVALYVEGENGKADTCTSNVTLKDVYAPNAQCADITVYLEANGQVAIPPASLDGGSEDNCDITGWDSTFPMADCDEVGTHFALLLVSDAAGNTDVCISEITVADTLGSLLTAAITDTTVVLNASCEAVVPDLTGAVMVSGGCSADIGGLYIGQFPAAGTAIPEDTTVVSLFIEGSTADSLEITLSVAPDTITPELSIYTPWGSLLQQDTLRVSTLDTSCATVTTLELVPSDNCPSADTFAITAVLTDSLSDASPDFGVVYDADNEQYRFELSAEDGWYAFDFSVTDAFGNAGTASLIVLVQDSIPPVAVCEDAEVSVTPTQGSSISFADIGIGSTDNCGLMDITLSQTQFTCADAGPQPVVLTLTDQFGNSSECTAIVTVVNALQGLPCDDGDDCTINDRYLIDCGCAGDLLDTNDNGVCDLDEGCIEPANLAAEVDSPTSGTFSWSAVPQAQSYRFQYRPIGGGGVSMDVTENEVPLTGLPQGSTIQWRVRALCDGENSAFVIGPALNLAVPGTTWAELSGGDEDYQNFSTPVQEASGNPFKLFPNPVRDKAYLVFEQPFSGVVTISSILGQQLYRLPVDSQKQLELDLSDWKSSHQLLLITVADGHSAPVTKRVLVAR